MTKLEARIAVLDRVPDRRTQRWILSDIKYEKHEGIHTYHLCSCGRKQTRAGKCSLCLREMLEVAVLAYVYVIKDENTGLYIPKNVSLYSRVRGLRKYFIPTLVFPENAKVWDKDSPAQKTVILMNKVDKENKYSFSVQKLALIPDVNSV